MAVEAAALAVAVVVVFAEVVGVVAVAVVDLVGPVEAAVLAEAVVAVVGTVVAAAVAADGATVAVGEAAVVTICLAKVTRKAAAINDLRSAKNCRTHLDDLDGRRSSALYLFRRTAYENRCADALSGNVRRSAG